MAELRPITRNEAAAFIAEYHRHHKPLRVGYLWHHAIHDEDGNVIGVAEVGRPVTQALDDGLTVEVRRLCTAGAANVCSMLYSAARRAAIAKGYRRGVTYILKSEDGVSLKASGWHELWKARGKTWNGPARARIDKHPTEDKVAWGWGAWPQLKDTRP